MPVGLIPPPVLEPINGLLDKLGYVRWRRPQARATASAWTRRYRPGMATCTRTWFPVRSTQGTSSARNR